MKYEYIKECENRYHEFKAEIKKDSDKFISEYIFFAFSDEQLLNGLSERNLKVEDCYSIGNGGIIAKKDAEVVHTFFDNIQKREDSWYREDPQNVVGAVYCALWDTEFCYHNDLQEVQEYLNIAPELLDSVDVKKIIEVYNERCIC